MSQSILLERLALAALVACLISSCARNSEPHSHDEVTELKSELEQLANQVGRLEFRIYELENNHSSQPSTGDAVAEPDDSHSGNNAATPADTETNAGRFDLTPVNP